MENKVKKQEIVNRICEEHITEKEKQENLIKLIFDNGYNKCKKNVLKLMKELDGKRHRWSKLKQEIEGQNEKTRKFK